MIRPLTLLCLTAAAGAGLYLYQVKHQVALLDRELRDIRRATEQAFERTAVLRAEWALLNEPERLRQVAMRHLSLEPMQPQQFIRLSELERRLQPAQVFAGAPSLFDPPPQQPPHAPSAPATMLASSAAPAPVAEAPAPARSAPPRPAAPEPVAARPAAPEQAPRPSPVQRPSVVASAVAAPARPQLRPVVHVQPTAAAAAESPQRRQSRPASEALARIARGGPVDLREPEIASALGAVRPTLAPPVPVSPAAAATLR